MLEKEMRDKLKRIVEELGKENTLCQLSEECSELAQACLKYIRAEKGLTPKTVEETRENIIEEIADVLSVISQVIYLFGEESVSKEIEKVQKYKTDRWYRRTFVSQEEN